MTSQEARATTLSSRHSRGYFGIIVGALFLVLSVIKMRAYLGSGRFWAEEGAVFYRKMQYMSPLEGIFFIFNGHLELITNIIVYSSRFTGLHFAPLVTTYASFAMQLIPIFFILKYREKLSLTRFGVVVVIILAAGLPQASEVWANSINLHFHFSLLAALIAAVHPDAGPPKWVSRLLLAMAGLSGIPANFLLPIFAALAFHSRQKERWIQLFIMSLTTALQIGLLAMNHFEAGSRSYFSTPWAYWLAPVAQSVLSPLFGVSVGEELTRVLGRVSDLKTSYLLYAAFLSIPFIYIFAVACSNRLQPRGVMALSAFLLMFASIFAAAGNKMDLISSMAGGRYFYAPNLLFAIALISCIRRCNSPIILVIFVLIFNSLMNVNKYIGGPSWDSNFTFSREKGDDVYHIWEPLTTP